MSWAIAAAAEGLLRKRAARNLELIVEPGRRCPLMPLAIPACGPCRWLESSTWE